jgi:hypothetical protein
VQIRIDGFDLPGRSCGPSPDSPGGYPNVHVAVQRRGRRDELLGRVPGDAPAASWTLDTTVASRLGRLDLTSPFIQGPPSARFIYLSRGTVGDNQEFTLFRRAKLWLDGVPPAVLDQAIGTGLLIGRLGLTDAKGWPVCAAVRPPQIEWLAGVPG